MKKQLITMGAVGLAMAGMNSGACADEVQAHPAATPNAVQTEAKTPQQQADSAREELLNGPETNRLLKGRMSLKGRKKFKGNRTSTIRPCPDRSRHRRTPMQSSRT